MYIKFISTRVAIYKWMPSVSLTFFFFSSYIRFICILAAYTFFDFNYDNTLINRFYRIKSLSRPINRTAQFGLTLKIYPRSAAVRLKIATATFHRAENNM